MEDKNKKFLNTFTKRWVSVILIVAIIDMQLSYILAYFGKENIAESLSIAIATEIIGVMIGYFAKSFLETHSEKKNELESMKLGLDLSNDNISDLEDEELINDENETNDLINDENESNVG